MERVPRTGAGQCCAPIALHPDTSGGSGLPLVRARMYRFPVGRQEVFFPSSCAGTSPFGWFLSGDHVRHPCRCNTLSVVAVAVVRPNFFSSAWRRSLTINIPA